MARTATLTRMVLPDHECPYGVRAKAMLEQAGFTIDEHILSTRAEVYAFKQKAWPCNDAVDRDRRQGDRGFGRARRVARGCVKRRPAGMA